MLYSFARVSAVLGMRRQDYFQQGSRGWLRLHEKGGKRHDVPAHHRAAEALDKYVEAAEIEEPKATLFQSVEPAGRRLTGRALQASVPSSIEGIEKYLGSGMIRGIGPVYARRMVQLFGTDVFDIIEASPGRLREVEGIGPTRADRINRGLGGPEDDPRDHGVPVPARRRHGPRGAHLQDLRRRCRAGHERESLPAGPRHPGHRLPYRRSDRGTTRAIPVVRLTDVFRQAATSRIVASAHRINAGRMPEFNAGDGESDFYFVPAEDPEQAVERILTLVRDRIPGRFGLDPVRDIQVLCPMNRGGAGARALNIELQAALNPAGEEQVERFGWTFAPGDKVMQIENDYDKDVYNGDIGTVEGVDADEGELTAGFDGRRVTYGFGELDRLVLAYAATIHKSQGSEYPAVVIPVLTQHYAMLQRNLLYTGITRGKRLVVLVGQPKAVAIAVKNVSGRRRWSKLDEWLGGWCMSAPA